MNLHPKKVNFIVFIYIFLVLLFSLYVQFGMKIQPCSMCVFERLAMLACGVVFLLAFLHNPKKFGIKFYALFSFLLAVVGVILSSKHIWLQYSPNAIASCGGASLDFLLQALPITEVIKEVFNGTADCTKKDAMFFGISMPIWGLIAFLFIGIASLNNLFYKSKSYNNDIMLNLK